MSMAARTEAEQKELVRIWDSLEARLARVKDIGDFLNDDVLEIKREQYLSDGKWVTSHYILVTGTGGPHVEFNTNHLISVYWGGGQQESVTYDDDAVNTIDQIFDYLEEIYPS